VNNQKATDWNWKGINWKGLFSTRK